MYIGLDTHQKAYTLVALDKQGRTHRIQTIPNTPEGWAMTCVCPAGDESRKLGLISSGERYGAPNGPRKSSMLAQDADVGNHRKFSWTGGNAGIGG